MTTGSKDNTLKPMIFLFFLIGGIEKLESKFLNRNYVPYIEFNARVLISTCANQINKDQNHHRRPMVAEYMWVFSS